MIKAIVTYITLLIQDIAINLFTLEGHGGNERVFRILVDICHIGHKSKHQFLLLIDFVVG